MRILLLEVSNIQRLVISGYDRDKIRVIPRNEKQFEVCWGAQMRIICACMHCWTIMNQTSSRNKIQSTSCNRWWQQTSIWMDGTCRNTFKSFQETLDTRKLSQRKRSLKWATVHCRTSERVITNLIERGERELPCDGMTRGRISVMISPIDTVYRLIWPTRVYGKWREYPTLWSSKKAAELRDHWVVSSILYILHCSWLYELEMDYAE